MYCTVHCTDLYCTVVHFCEEAAATVVVSRQWRSSLAIQRE